MRLACASVVLGTLTIRTPSWTDASIVSARTWLGRVIDRLNGPKRRSTRCALSNWSWANARSPGIAGLLKTRDPLGPHSLALAEAFLEALQPAGLPDRQTALAFSLIYDYTVGFALSDRGTVNEHRVQDPATRLRLHDFLKSLPASQFPALAAFGEHVWTDSRDERFTAGVQQLLGGIEAA